LRNHPKERIQHSEQGEISKSIIFLPVNSQLVHTKKRLIELKSSLLFFLSFHSNSTHFCQTPASYRGSPS